MMDVDHLCQDLRSRTGAVFTYSETGSFFRIRTPYLCPDGDNIDVFCKVEGETVTVSDLAETAGWFRMQSGELHLSAEQKRVIEEACGMYGIEWNHGTLRARCGPGGEVAQVVIRVARAMLRVPERGIEVEQKAGR